MTSVSAQNSEEGCGMPRLMTSDGADWVSRCPSAASYSAGCPLALHMLLYLTYTKWTAFDKLQRCLYYAEDW